MSEIVYTDDLSRKARIGLANWICVNELRRLDVQYIERYEIPPINGRSTRALAKMESGTPVIYVNPSRNKTIHEWLEAVLHEIGHIKFDDFGYNTFEEKVGFILSGPVAERRAEQFAEQNLNKWLKVIKAFGD